MQNTSDLHIPFTPTLIAFHSIYQNLLHRPAVMPEYKAAAIEKSRFILSHYGVFKTCWDWLILVGTFYVAIVVPYSATFRDSGESPLNNKTIITDVIMESIFIIGIYHFFLSISW